MSKRMSRRKFLSKSTQIATAMIYMPTVLDLLIQQKAYGASCATGASINQHPFINLIAQGGCQMPTMFVPLDASGGLMSNAQDGSIMGLGASGTNRVIQSPFGPNCASLYSTIGGISTGFYSKLNSYLNTAIQNNTALLVTHARVPDDRSGMGFDPVGLVRLSKALSGNQGSLFPSGIGNIPGVSGSSHLYVDSANTIRPTVVTDFIGIRAAASAPALVGELPSASRNRFFDALTRLNDSQLKRYLTRDLATQMSDILGCTVQRAAGAVNSGMAAQVDIRQNSALVAHFQASGVDITTWTDTSSKLYIATLAHLSALGAIGDVSIKLSENYDYHFNSVPTEITTANQYLGDYVGIILKIWEYHGVQKGGVSLETDGGCSSVGGPMQFVSDRGLASMTALFLYNHSGRPNVGTGYLGKLNEFQAADDRGTNGELGWTTQTEKLGASLFANYAKAAGRLENPGIQGELIRIFGSAQALQAALAA